MRVQKEHKEYAAVKLQEGAMNKREIMEHLQAGAVKIGDKVVRLTRSQANSCVRNQAKRLNLYNELTEKDKNNARIASLSADASFQATVSSIQERMNGGSSKPVKKGKRKRGKIWGDDDSAAFEKFGKKNKQNRQNNN